jgi:hypothetical protein
VLVGVDVAFAGEVGRGHEPCHDGLAVAAWGREYGTNPKLAMEYWISSRAGASYPRACRLYTDSVAAASVTRRRRAIALDATMYIQMMDDVWVWAYTIIDAEEGEDQRLRDPSYDRRGYYWG